MNENDIQPEEDSSDATENARIMRKRFSDELRDVTREIHTVSDNLANMKLGVAMSNDKIWAQGLMLFYPIFKYLEEGIKRHEDSLIGEFNLDSVMNRAEAFEKDLKFFLGEQEFEKQSNNPPQCVVKYLNHLKDVEDEDPYLLIPYIYHLYMGLLSGGQILQAKRKFVSRFKGKASENDVSGVAITSFGSDSLMSLKGKMRQIANNVAEELPEETKDIILKESVRVFELNNDLMSTVKGVNEIFYHKVIIFISVSVAVFSILVMILYAMLRV